jgi:hypothetical protein
MLFNHHEAEQMMKARAKDVLREAEQARLIRASKGPTESRRWWRPVTLILTSLLAISIPILKGRRTNEPRGYTLSETAHSKPSCQPAECRSPTTLANC